MKLLVSVALFPSLLAILLSGGCYGFYAACGNSPATADYTGSGHLLCAFLYLAIAIGLPLAVYSAVTGILLAAASFIFKSWSRAVVSIAVAGCGIYLWRFFLTVPYPGA